MKLLVATLSLGQVSGQRQKLRGNTHAGNRNANERRKMQVFAFTDESQEATYDDYFQLPTDVEYAGDPGLDDYFATTGSGNVFNWQGSGSGGGGGGGSGGGSGVTPKGDSKSAKTSKFGKAITQAETVLLPKGMKADKGSPPPPKGPQPKSSKSGKGLKSMKAVKTAKGSIVGGNMGGNSAASASSSAGDDSLIDDIFGESRVGGSFVQAGSGTSSYSDYFSYGSNTGRTDTDDYFAPKTRSEVVSGRNSFVETVSVPQGRSETTGSKQQRQWNDDYFHEDELVVFRPRPAVTIGGSVFMANPQSLIAPVVPDGTGDTLSMGTEYLFNEMLEDASNIVSQLVPVEVDSVRVNFHVSLDGYCDRIGPADQNSVQGYCFFTYTFIDPATQLISGAFTAQGIIVNSITPGQLTVTGGTGIMTGATGLVEVLPASIDSSVQPPLLIQPPSSADPFNGVAGWAHFFEFDVDVLFFLPDLYAPSRT